MGEYIWTRVTIGGTLKRSDVERLTDEMRFESDRDGDDTGELELEAAMKENRAAVVYEGESNYGGATSMLALLHELGLPYRKECDHHYEYDADIETWDGHPEHNSGSLDLQQRQGSGYQPAGAEARGHKGRNARRDNRQPRTGRSPTASADYP